MPSPFPGMDPYLERPDLWPDVHHRLITAMGDELAQALRPRYFVAVETHVFVAVQGTAAYRLRPDVSVVRPAPGTTEVREVAVTYEAVEAIEPATWTAVATDVEAVMPVSVTVPELLRQGFLEIRTTEGNEVISVIELLSPANKQPGQGRREYEAKRNSLLQRPIHLVEIDLLRVGEPMPMSDPGLNADYRILVSPHDRRPLANLYAFRLPQPIPSVPVPLAAGETPVTLALNRLLHAVYDHAGYDLRIDYGAEPVPPMPPGAAAWMETLREAAVGDR